MGMVVCIRPQTEAPTPTMLRVVLHQFFKEGKKKKQTRRHRSMHAEKLTDLNLTFILPFPVADPVDVRPLPQFLCMSG